jgi:hypothetical protein
MTLIEIKGPRGVSACELWGPRTTDRAELYGNLSLAADRQETGQAESFNPQHILSLLAMVLALSDRRRG